MILAPHLCIQLSLLITFDRHLHMSHEILKYTFKNCSGRGHTDRDTPARCQRTAVLHKPYTGTGTEIADTDCGDSHVRCSEPDI